MKKEVGVWIDHRQAMILINLDQEESVEHVRYYSTLEANSENVSHNDTPEGVYDRYYWVVITSLHNATRILIMGPGEAKSELQKRLADYGIGDGIVAIKAADKMSDSQIAGEVRQYFRDLQIDLNQTTHINTTTQQ